MRILLDGRPLQGTTGRRGVGRYVRELTHGLLEQPGEHLVDLLYDPREGALHDPPRHLRSALLEVRAPRGPALLWGRVLGPSWIRASAAEFWHATFLAPPRVPRGFPWVATIHDLIPLCHPKLFSLRQREVFQRSLALSARAPRVVAVSDFTAKLIVERLGTPRERIRVVPPPVDLNAFHNSAWRGLRGIDEPYLLHLGGFDPLKGVEDLLLPAFARLVKTQRELLLVLTGGDCVARIDAQRVARELGVIERVVFAGQLSSPAHEAAVAGARAVVVSSREEGFGIPAVEALAAGVPLVIGPAHATREIGGDEVCRAGAATPAALAEAMSAALEQGREVSAALRRSAEPYGRAAVAKELLAIYRELGRA